MSSSGSIRVHRSVWDFAQPAMDAACIYGSIWLVWFAARGYVEEAATATGLIAIILFLLAGQLTGLYRRWNALSSDQEVLAVVGTWTLTLLTLAMLGFLTRYSDSFARSVSLTWAIVAPCQIAMARMLARLCQRVLLKRGIGVRRVAIAGHNELGFQIAENIDRQPGLGLQLCGFFDDRGKPRSDQRSHAEFTLDGGLAQMVDLARRGEVDIVMITLPMRAESRIKFVLDQLSDSTVSVYIVPDFFVFELLHSRWTNMGGLPAVSVFENPFYGVDGWTKRCLDTVLCLAALVVAAIPMAAIALAIKISSPGPIFFRQRRYGLDGREIRVWKFRTMDVCDDGAVVRQATKNDPRITPLGAILRRTSLDELPQLFNVLDGSMSLVGPRPHATAHNEQFRVLIRGYMLRHKVRPGITGLAQVSGCRGETDTIEKMKRRVDWDHRYIRHWSLWLDLKILFKTVWVAWRQPEAY